MGGASSKHDGIDGVKPYWVHVGTCAPIKGDGEVLLHDDYHFDGYIVLRWLTENGDPLQNRRGVSAFQRHGHYLPMSNSGGGEFNEIMDFNLMFTQLCKISFHLCERKDGINGMWDHSSPLAIAEPTITLKEMIDNGVLGKPQTVDFIQREEKPIKIGVRLTFIVGDDSITKPEIHSEAMVDIGNGPVEMVEDKNGDGEITAHDTGVPPQKPKLIKANSSNLKHSTVTVAENPNDDV